MVKYSGARAIWKRPMWAHINLSKYVGVLSDFAKNLNIEASELRCVKSQCNSHTKRRVGALYKRMKKYQQASVWISSSSRVVYIFSKTKGNTKNTKCLWNVLFALRWEISFSNVIRINYLISISTIYGCVSNCAGANESIRVNCATLWKF